MEFAVALGLTSLYIRIPKPHERNPGKMTFTTASGLLPAGIAVYVQRGPNGVGLEMRYPFGLEGFTSQSETRRTNSLLPAWEAGSSDDDPAISAESESIGSYRSWSGLCSRRSNSERVSRHVRREWPAVDRCSTCAMCLEAINAAMERYRVHGTPDRG